jgi:Skp family chaperone for outer membrane proteins
LTELEARLAKLDGDDSGKEDTEWRVSLSIHHENGKHNEERKELMEEIDRKLEAYGKRQGLALDLD